MITSSVNDWASIGTLTESYFLFAIFLLICIFHLKRTVFNKHVDDVGLRTDQERNLFINGPKQEQNHPRSSELDLEEIENVDNESTEGCYSGVVQQT